MNYLEQNLAIMRTRDPESGLINGKRDRLQPYRSDPRLMIQTS